LSGDAHFLSNWLRSMPPAPHGCAYLNFTASHDGIGMRPAEGLLPDEEIARMISTVQDSGGRASMRALPNGGTSVYELNATFFSALSRTYRGDTANHIARFLCSQTIVMSIEGVPAFYIHAMLGTENDIEGVERRGMNRAINRHRWDYPELRKRIKDPETPQGQVLPALKERLKLRAKQPAFHPNATNFTLNVDDRVFCVWRQSINREQSIFALHNVSAETVDLPPRALNLIADEEWIDLLSGETLHPEEDGVTLAPYQCRWITNRG
ncbi:MAG: alpha-amylase, partial [Sagittula sp.]